jgi:hypothetical protein
MTTLGAPVVSRQLHNPPTPARAYVYLLLVSSAVGLIWDNFNQADLFDQGLPMVFFLINFVVRMLPPILLAEGIWRRQSSFVWVVALIYSAATLVGFLASWSFNRGSFFSALGSPSIWIHYVIAIAELILLLVPATREWVRGQGPSLAAEPSEARPV